MQNINFGIQEREQPDLAVSSDINLVRVEINGKIHIYNQYDQRKNFGDAFSIEQSVKFQKLDNTYGGVTYTRSVYASDVLNAEHKGSTAESDKLKINVTYVVKLKNQSTVLTSRVNEITQYYDKKYTAGNVIAGTTLEGTGKVNSSINVGSTEVNTGYAEYNKVTMQPNMEINPGEEKQIYIMLEVSQDGLKEVVTIGAGTNEKLKLDSIVEITSYTTKKNGNIIAGIDIDSRPGNANPNKISNPTSVGASDPTTYEDDTERAPGFILQMNGPRETTGKVFLDSIEKPVGVTSTDQLMTDKERKGNGKYEQNNANERGIQNVTVELIDKNGNTVDVYDEGQRKWVPAKQTTDSNGNYTIGGFIPGEYRIKFTWGDGTYKVQDYKGTIYTQTRSDYTHSNAPYQPEVDNQWYKKDGTERYSDAIDNYSTRQTIDSQTSTLTNKTKANINEAYGSNPGNLTRSMDSYTPLMDVRIEYQDTVNNYTADGESVKDFKIENLDFGIVQRPKQEISLEKHVKKVTLKLANGVTLIDAEVIKDGLTGMYKLKEDVNYTVFWAEASGTRGRLKMEVDKEIVQGATLQIEYELIIRNISERDWVTENYYKYGIAGTFNQLTSLKPHLIDYVDGQVSVEAGQANWKICDEATKEALFTNGLLNASLREYVNQTERICTNESITDELRVGGNDLIIPFKTTKIITSGEDINIGNDTEILRVEKSGGSTILSTPGNYNPSNLGTDESDSDLSEDVLLVRPTGENRDYAMYTIIGIIILGLIATGAILIKKKVLK